ncbi:hypothetical protein BpHYR1_001165 [Brachionus plicatilis]|uniref:Uncharacterized protein n=1 Tax=Brachionus plicatilis TaxID=10195 RepID=A0A3M7RKV6_BRAPC|nr:hypothetical protein BpHYR1_001165 [Brachionus plicatilis]
MSVLSRMVTFEPFGKCLKFSPVPIPTPEKNFMKTFRSRIGITKAPMNTLDFLVFNSRSPMDTFKYDLYD